MPARWGGTAGKTKMNPSPDRPTLNPMERDPSPAFDPKSSFKFQPQHTRSRSAILPPSFWGRVTERLHLHCRCPAHLQCTGIHGQNARRGESTPFSRTAPCSATSSLVLGSPSPRFRSMSLRKISFNLTNRTAHRSIELGPLRVRFTTFRHRPWSAHPIPSFLLIEAAEAVENGLVFDLSAFEELDPTFHRVSASCDYRMV